MLNLIKEVKLTLTPGKEDEFKKEVEKVEQNLKDSIAKQTELSKSLTDAVANAQKENVKVTVKSDKVVSLKDSDEAIKKELEKINTSNSSTKRKTSCL